jgi:hypothetical protein
MAPSHLYHALRNLPTPSNVLMASPDARTLERLRMAEPQSGDWWLLHPSPMPDMQTSLHGYLAPDVDEDGLRASKSFLYHTYILLCHR